MGQIFYIYKKQLESKYFFHTLKALHVLSYSQFHSSPEHLFVATISNLFLNAFISTK